MNGGSKSKIDPAILSRGALRGSPAYGSNNVEKGGDDESKYSGVCCPYQDSPLEPDQVESNDADVVISGNATRSIGKLEYDWVCLGDSYRRGDRRVSRMSCKMLARRSPNSQDLPTS